MNTQFLIAAPSSGSGKTTIARGLMALLASKGYKVQPFKCGPDYIDTKFHEAVCGRPSINLDTFMAAPEYVRELFVHYGAGADVCIVEGMMGLFDGYDRERGSCYEIARVLGLPIVLVVDARSAAYSMAALLSGFLQFRADACFAGVIFNKVGSPRHAAMLQQVCEDLKVPCLGLLPKCAQLEQASRYLGLDFSQYSEDGSLLSLIQQHVDWQRLLSASVVGRSAPPLGSSKNASERCISTVDDPFCHARRRDPLRALVARNAESFSFIYAETLDLLGDVRFFDPETDVPDFDAIDLLYLPGGYPEKHLEALVANEACRTAIRAFAECGGRIVAECGGMMYLCRSIVTDAVVGRSALPLGSSKNASERCNSADEDSACHAQRRDPLRFPMCGVLPYDISARREDRRLSLGYRRFTLEGREYRGHEFHYTQFIGPVPPSATQVYDALGRPVATPVFRYKNVLASYTHLYAGFILNDE